MTLQDYRICPVRATNSLVADAEVHIKKNEGRALKSGGLWIYDNEVDAINGDFKNGCILNVLDFDGYFLGYGFINTNSTIRVRVLSRMQADVITPAFLSKRVEMAWDYRKKVIDTSSCRVIFGEADFLPGLTVDKYEDVLVVESLALGIEKLKPLLLSALVQTLEKDGILIRGIYERSDAKVREKEGLPRTKGFLSEEFDTLVPIKENGVSYIVDVKDGQKTGFFLDQKLNRKAIWPLCGGADVLDCFCHTGSFGLNALYAGASHVLFVDASETAMEQTKINVRLNGFEDKADFATDDVFSFLPAQQKKLQRFDVVILDPPAFTKSRGSVKAAASGYRQINREGLLLVKDGGFLVTCSCSHFMDPQKFQQAIAQASRDAHKRLRQVAFRQQAPDHPFFWDNDTSYYLKFYIFQVFPEK